MKAKRITALLLALMTVILSAACTDKPDSGKEDGYTAPDSVIESEAVETTIADTLTTKDYDGYAFRIFGEEMRDYYYFEEATGDVIEDAVYNRNQRVSELFNVKFEYKIITWGTGYTYIQQLAQTADNAHDLLTNSHQSLGPVITGGCIQNWNKAEEYMDFGAPWYIQDANKTFSIGSNMMLLFGDYLESTIRNCWCFVFNKAKMADYNIPDLYQAVDDGKWTVDYLMQITDGIYSDLNGNGKEDKGDFYGFITDSYAAVDSFCRTLGLSAISKDSNNYPYLDFFDEHTVEAYELMYKLYYEHEGTYVNNAAFQHVNELFATGCCVISDCMLIHLQDKTVRDMKDDFGVLPYPKYNEAQDMGYTHMDGTFSAMMLPITLSDEDIERTALITEALNALSYDMVRPALYEVSLQNKLARDDDSARMIDLVLAGRRFSFDSLDEAGFKLSPYGMREQMQKKQNQIASYYAKYEKSAQKWIEKLIAAYEESTQA